MNKNNSQQNQVSIGFTMPALFIFQVFFEEYIHLNLKLFWFKKQSKKTVTFQYQIVKP